MSLRRCAEGGVCLNIPERLHGGGGVFGAGGHPERGASLVCVSKGVPCVCFKYLKCILDVRGKVTVKRVTYACIR